MKGEIKLVKLKELKPNPRRDFKVDPIDAEEVNILAKSIHQHGFWGGTVCRKLDDGSLEIVAGHRRVAAAIEAGEKEAELFVGRFDEPSIIRVYATENATQRGNTSTAVTGSVASALRYLVKAILKNDEGIWQICQKGDLEKIRGNLTSEKGIGRDIIERFLVGVPGINESVIKDQLANLKVSGDYARIVKEVSGEIEQERLEAEAELKRAEQEAAEAKKEEEKRQAEEKEARAKTKVASAQTAGTHAQKAAASVNGKKPAFDLEGVTKHLKSANQVNTFRKSVTSAGISELLPVKNQAALAAELVKLSESGGHELSGAFIKENITALVIETKAYVRNATREQIEQLERHDIRVRFERYQDDFGRNVRGMHAAGVKLLDLMKENRDRTFNFSRKFQSELANIQSVITKLVDKL